MKLLGDYGVFMGAIRREDFSERVSDSRFAILGVPMDWTSSFRPGSRFGPGAIRLASWSLEEYSVSLGGSLEDFAFEDWGDVDLPPGNPERSVEVVERATQLITELGMRPMSLGGEHLLTLGVLRALRRRHEDMALLYLDAHADLRDEYAGERYSHATVLRRIVDEVGVRHVFAVGTRSSTEEERRLLGDICIQCGSPDDFGDALKRGVELVSSRPVYLSIDIDVVDPAFAPGTGCPEPGGPSSRDVLKALESLRGLRVIGADVVEVSPPHDPSGITAVLASRLVRDILIMFSCRGRRGCERGDTQVAW